MVMVTRFEAWRSQKEEEKKALFDTHSDELHVASLHSQFSDIVERTVIWPNLVLILKEMM